MESATHLSTNEVIWKSRSSVKGVNCFKDSVADAELDVYPLFQRDRSNTKVVNLWLYVIVRSKL